MLRRAALVATVALALLSTGCAELLRMLAGGVQTPSAAFQSAALDTISLDDATVAATFQITNPNPIGLNLAGVGYAVTFEGQPLFEGNFPTGIQLAANATSPLTVPVRIPFSAIPNLATTLLTKTEAKYEVRGAVTVRSPIGDLTLPIHWGGTLPLPQLPKLSVSGARVQNLSFSGARIVVTLAVNNPNVFALPLTALTGRVLVAEQQVAALALPASKPLAAKTVTAVEIPIDVSFASAGFAVSTAMARGSAALRLQGSASVAGKTLPLDLGTTLQ
jgi:LEA14-like dessication related protein